MQPNFKKIPIVAVVGPTASGKTDIAIKIAKRFNGEIVSCDSMQIYKEMNIGTAKPTKEEMQGIPHHLIDFLTLSDDFSVAEYTELAHKVIFDIYKREKLPIVVGGTGLYVDSLLTDIDFKDIGSDQNIRKELEDIFNMFGTSKLYEMLLECDPKEAEIIDKDNPKRLIRALEVCKITGKTMTEYKQNNLSNKSRYISLKIGINYENRQDLYDKINQRVDIMIKNGLENEAKQIFAEPVIKTAYQAIGYKEFLSYFNGEQSFTESVDKIKLRSRRYAKRQLTWFRRDKNIIWFDKSPNIDNHEIEKNIFTAVENFINVCYN